MKKYIILIIAGFFFNILITFHSENIINSKKSRISTSETKPYVKIRKRKKKPRRNKRTKIKKIKNDFKALKEEIKKTYNPELIRVFNLLENNIKTKKDITLTINKLNDIAIENNFQNVQEKIYQNEELFNIIKKKNTDNSLQRHTVNITINPLNQTQLIEKKININELGTQNNDIKDIPDNQSLLSQNQIQHIHEIQKNINNLVQITPNIINQNQVNNVIQIIDSHKPIPKNIIVLIHPDKHRNNKEENTFFSQLTKFINQYNNILKENTVNNNIKYLEHKQNNENHNNTTKKIPQDTSLPILISNNTLEKKQEKTETEKMEIEIKTPQAKEHPLNQTQLIEKKININELGTQNNDIKDIPDNQSLLSQNQIQHIHEIQKNINNLVQITPNIINQNQVNNVIQIIDSHKPIPKNIIVLIHPDKHRNNKEENTFFSQLTKFINQYNNILKENTVNNNIKYLEHKQNNENHNNTTKKIPQDTSLTILISNNTLEKKQEKTETEKKEKKLIEEEEEEEEFEADQRRIENELIKKITSRKKPIQKKSHTTKTDTKMEIEIEHPQITKTQSIKTAKPNKKSTQMKKTQNNISRNENTETIEEIELEKIKLKREKKQELNKEKAKIEAIERKKRAEQRDQKRKLELELENQLKQEKQNQINKKEALEKIFNDKIEEEILDKELEELEREKKRLAEERIAVNKKKVEKRQLEAKNMKIQQGKRLTEKQNNAKTLKSTHKKINQSSLTETIAKKRLEIKETNQKEKALKDERIQEEKLALERLTKIQTQKLELEPRIEKPQIEESKKNRFNDIEGLKSDINFDAIIQKPIEIDFTKGLLPSGLSQLATIDKNNTTQELPNEEILDQLPNQNNLQAQYLIQNNQLYFNQINTNNPESLPHKYNSGVNINNLYKPYPFQNFQIPVTPPSGIGPVIAQQGMKFIPQALKHFPK